MRKMIAAGFTALLLASGAGAAVAGHNPDGSGHLPQDKGLCTAYFNGSERGQEQKRKAGPFTGLEERAEAVSDSEGAEAVAEYCGTLVGGRDPEKGAPGGDNAGPKE